MKTRATQTGPADVTKWRAMWNEIQATDDEMGMASDMAIDMMVTAEFAIDDAEIQSALMAGIILGVREAMKWQK